MKQEMKKKNKTWMIVLIILLVISILFNLLLFLSLGTYVYETDYYKEMMLQQCELSHELMDTIELYQMTLSLYTPAYNDVQFPELEDCRYWLLD